MSSVPPMGQGPIDPRATVGLPPPPGGIGGPPPFPTGFGAYVPPPRPPREGGRSFARAIFTTLATTVFGLSILLNVYLLAISGLSGNGMAKQIVLEEGDSKHRVAVVPVSGLIDDEAYVRLDKLLKQVEKDQTIQAVVIEIDSPGGSVTASDEMYERVEEFKKNRGGVPVVISQRGLAASGGYYLSCAGDYVYAERTTMTGNIGVLMPRFNVSKLFDKWGVDDVTLHSTGADYKDAGSMFKPENAKDVAYIQNLVDKAFVQFKAVVSTGRANKLNRPIDEVANGKVYTADEAVALGLVDAIGYPHDAYHYAATLKGMGSPEVVKFEQTPSLRDLLAGRSSVGSPSAGGGTVTVDWKSVQEAMSPRLMYLWQGQ